jgi:hypothetical protein
MKIEFKNYEDYSEFVTEEWESGNINELEEDGYTVLDSTVFDESGLKTEMYRKLTEEEFKNLNNG